MANEIDSGKLYIRELFQKWFRIPEYQRPYVWGKDQINDLLDDIYFAQQTNPETEYFLGSIIFQTDTGDIGVDVLDGQQRLTTLFLITSVIRDLTENEKLKNVCKKMIFQEGNEFEGIPERIRIIFDIREEVKDFVDNFIKVEGKLNDIETLKKELSNSRDVSVKNMINAIFEIQDYFKKNYINIEEFFKYLNNKVLVIYVSSSSLEDAFKLFTVMNDRGIKLRNSDILKAENLRYLNKTDREKYAKEWEEIENYFEDYFDTFLSHYHYDVFGDYKFDNLISIMKNVLPSDLWIAPLLRYYDKFGNQLLVRFLEKLDNKFSSDWIIGLTPTSRIENINTIIKKIDSTDKPEELLEDEIFKINCKDFINVVNDNIYGRRFAKYILYKLDYLYGGTDKINIPKTISVEHILPQNPGKNSQWEKDFTPAQREEWTHKIGNLILISRRKNSSQGRKDFKEKKREIF